MGAQAILIERGTSMLDPKFQIPRVLAQGVATSLRSILVVTALGIGVVACNDSGVAAPDAAVVDSSVATPDAAVVDSSMDPRDADVRADATNDDDLGTANDICGDSSCTDGETQASCCVDCGCPGGQSCDGGTCTELPSCGDGMCNGSETRGNCCVDCGCPSGQSCLGGTCMQNPSCGDGSCNGGETQATCCGDCGCQSAYACISGTCQPSCGAIGGGICEAGGNGACNGLGPATYDCDHCCGGSVNTPSCGGSGGTVCDVGGGQCNGQGTVTYDCDRCCGGSITPSCAAIGGNDCETSGNGLCGGQGTTTYDCDHCCTCGGRDQACCGGGSCDGGLSCINSLCRCGALSEGETLSPGQSISSCNVGCGGRGYTLVMQADGNLVLYETPEYTALWASDWDGETVPGASAVFQDDGNFVVYGPGCNYAGLAGVCWTPFTASATGASMAIQTDGNIVIYASDCPGGVCWNSGSGATVNLRVQSSLEDYPSYCWNAGVWYTLEAITYFWLDDQGYYLDGSSAYVDFPRSLYTSPGGRYQLCYLDACAGASSCWTRDNPSVPCTCNPPQDWGTYLNACENRYVFPS